MYVHPNKMKVIVFITYIISCFQGCDDGDVLLQNGTHTSANLTEGTVLVCYNNEYGTVCDDFWDDLEARVVCNQLGHYIGGLNIDHFQYTCTSP